jgi:hypothetical protein
MMQVHISAAASPDQARAWLKRILSDRGKLSTTITASAGPECKAYVSTDVTFDIDFYRENPCVAVIRKKYVQQKDFDCNTDTPPMSAWHQFSTIWQFDLANVDLAATTVWQNATVNESGFVGSSCVMIIPSDKFTGGLVLTDDSIGYDLKLTPGLRLTASRYEAVPSVYFCVDESGLGARALYALLDLAKSCGASAKQDPY